MNQTTGSLWVVYALLSALFAALTSILAKIGINGVDSNLATAIRTVVVLVMAWGLVFSEFRCIGFYDRCTETDFQHWSALLAVSGFIRNCNWTVLAILLPGAADGGCKQGRTD
ncbi:drug/metabolite transporter DMT family [Clostridium sp. CAG:242]|nr:drug/metabolite transporter DMT family [Clostridium sp. CAG:242]